MAIPTKADNRGVVWGEGADASTGPRLRPDATVTYIGPGAQTTEKDIGLLNADRVMSHRPTGFDFVMLPFLNRWRVYDLRKVTLKTIQNKMGRSIGKEYMLPEPVGIYTEREPAIALALLTYGS